MTLAQIVNELREFYSTNTLIDFFEVARNTAQQEYDYASARGKLGDRNLADFIKKWRANVLMEVYTDTMNAFYGNSFTDEDQIITHAEFSELGLDLDDMIWKESLCPMNLVELECDAQCIDEYLVEKYGA